MEIDGLSGQKAPSVLPDASWCRDLAVDCSPDLLVVVDPQLRVAWTNPAVEELLGYGHGEFWGESVLEFVHPEDVGRALGGLSKAFRREGYHVATRFRVRQRSGVWLSTRATASTVSVNASTWIVLSVRSVSGEVAEEQRRQRLIGFTQSVLVECAGMRHHEEESRSTAILASIATALGATSIALAELVGDDRHLLVRAVWAHKHINGAYAPRGQRAQPLSSIEAVRSLPCVITERGNRTYVEIFLHEQFGRSGVACLGFTPLPDTWDDANADLIALMCSTLLATVIRCSEERMTVLAATSDPLTGLLNRRALHDRLSSLVASAEVVGADLSLVFADVNNLKTLNDTQGHLEGDRVLAAIADAITSTIRTPDIAARVGGDEFVILVHCNAETLPQLVHRLRNAIEAALDTWKGVGIAIGAITVDPHDTPDDVLRRADLAMYLDKAEQKAGPVVPNGPGH
jgi:diguanylate cyclase (GGDEF)-like protein/PAS domain S-box-containing protein